MPTPKARAYLKAQTVCTALVDRPLASAPYAQPQGQAPGGSSSPKLKKFLAGEFVGLEGGVDPGAVEADNDVTSNVDDRDTALARFVNSFQAGSRVFFDILVLVFDAEFI
jgi:hypothetical protein